MVLHEEWEYFVCTVGWSTVLCHTVQYVGRKSSTQNKQTYFRNCARDSRDMGHTKENEKYW